ncbi:flagella basal body P-ring formation protein FlgA [Ferrimonas marina]|uniref:Flagella basal body P-ring formation protein FlgA n=1 Tax=Ferrimonas marina TaxID=299255 RepID=A0A1M5TEU4_9GAMM|nr:flagella basal body P-ring formation protein FlgA [Ferrimonas marina]
MRILLLAAGLALSTLPAHANHYEDAVQQYLASLGVDVFSVQVPGAPSDLEDCDQRAIVTPKANRLDRGVVESLCDSGRTYPFNATGVATVFATTRSLSRWSPVDRSSSAEAQANLRIVRSDMLFPDGLPRGHESTRPLRSGSYVRHSDLRPTPAIRKRQAVTLRTQMPGLVFDTSGEAIRDLQLGEVGKFINTRSGATVNARAISQGIALIER